MIKFFIQKNKGFTLVETLVAISIFSISIVAIMSVLGGGISDINYTKQKMSAGYLAQEGIEHLRNLRDTYYLSNISNTQEGWDQFKTNEIELIADNDNQYFYPITDPSFSEFTRTMRADTDVMYPDQIKISSTVSWTQKSGSFSTTFTEYLFNWVE